MFGFLAALGPLGIAAVVVGAIGVAIYVSSDSETDSNDRDDAVDTVRKETINEKNEKIHQNISNYKEKEKIRILKNFNANIDYVNGNEYINSTLIMPLSYGSYDKVVVQASNIESLSNTIAALEHETEEMINLVNILMEMKNESIG